MFSCKYILLLLIPIYIFFHADGSNVVGRRKKERRGAKEMEALKL
jgi:hypothetical protein